MYVRLSPKFGKTWHRYRRDANGKIVGDKLSFAQGQVVHLSPDDAEIIKHDIGKSLQAVNFNKHNSPEPVEVSIQEIEAAIADARKRQQMPIAEQPTEGSGSIAAAPTPAVDSDPSARSRRRGG